MAEEKNYKIYKYTSPSGKVYIGQTCQTIANRARKNGERYKECTHFWRAIQKYGWENFTLDILEDNLNSQEANEKEAYYISLYDSTNPKKGYNLKEGGNQAKMSDEIKKKLSKARLGMHHSEATKEKISNALKNKPKSEEHKKKLSEAAKNRDSNGFANHKHSEETKQKIADKNSKAVFCVETGIIYKSAAEACRALGKKSNHISDCINNPDRYKTFAGYHWKRIN